MTMSSVRPVTAVLFVSSCWLADHLIDSWLQAGNRIAALVVGAGRRDKYRLRRIASLKQLGIPVFLVRRPIDWPALISALVTAPADLAVCYGFHNSIPEAALRQFRLGGINFHPALLPYYRGPNPTACLVAERAVSKHGGLTLHRMSAAFDEGEILAQSAFLPADYRGGLYLLAAVAGTMVAMIDEVVPLFCAGDLLGTPQPAGEYGWARYVARRIDIGPDWCTDDIAAAASFLSRRPGVFVPVGATRSVRIGQLLHHLGPPTGQPPALRLFELEFDCADGRIVVARAHRLGRLTARVRNRLVPSTVPEWVARPMRYQRLSGGSAS